MKLIKHSIFTCIAFVLVGLSLLTTGLLGTTKLADGNTEFMVGTGIALSIVGTAKLVYLLSLTRNQEKREAFLMKRNEERIVFLAEKSRSIMFLLTVAAEYFLSLFFALTGQYQFVEPLSLVICVQLIGYLLTHRYYSSKY